MRHILLGHDCGPRPRLHRVFGSGTCHRAGAGAYFRCTRDFPCDVYYLRHWHNLRISLEIGVLLVLFVWSVYGMLSTASSAVLLGFALLHGIEHHAVIQCAIGWTNSVTFVCYRVAKSRPDLVTRLRHFLLGARLEGSSIQTILTA